MTAPLTILLADDQVPWETNAENERTKAEIRREFKIAKPHIDVDAAFADDYAWFTGLLSYLEQTKGETVIRARTFATRCGFPGPASPVERQRSVEDAESQRRCGDSVTLSPEMRHFFILRTCEIMAPRHAITTRVP